MKYVLDTGTMDDVAIEERGAPALERARREATRGNPVAFNAGSYYESLRGIFQAEAPKNLESIRQYGHDNVMELDLTSAEIAARIYAAARRQYGQIADSFSRDILIAAIALRNNAIVVTKNDRDFGRIQAVVATLIDEHPEDPALKPLRFESW